MLTEQTDFTPGMSESGILSRVRGFVSEKSLHTRRDLALGEDERLFDRGVADSEDVALMVGFIEEEFGVHVSGLEITEDNLGSLRAVARFVAGKQPFAVG
jgi:acyl carrier protein